MDGAVPDFDNGTNLKQGETQGRWHSGFASEQVRDVVRPILDMLSEVGRAAFGHHTAALVYFFLMLCMSFFQSPLNLNNILLLP